VTAHKFSAVTFYALCEEHPWFAIQSANEDFVDLRIKDHNEAYQHEDSVKTGTWE